MAVNLHCNLIALVVITLPVISHQLGCPEMPISSCSCSSKSHGLDITCENVPERSIRIGLEKVAATKQLVFYLKIRNSHLSMFPENLLGDLRVNHFMAMNCSISQIEDDAFYGLIQDLETLDLARNKLEDVPTKAMENLANVATLNLVYNNIEVIQAESFRGLISLLRLSLFGNKIKSIDPMAFHGIGGNLTQLNFGDNQLTTIPYRALRNLKVLERLQIHENQISMILTEGFDGMGEKLDTLEISNNRIEELPEKAFLGLKMNSLDFEENVIRSIHRKAFIGLEDTLEWLKLGKNRLTDIPSEALQILNRLRHLDLRENLISSINEDDFKDYGHHLKFLYLQKNQIYRIEEPHSFLPLDSLEWLYLQNNQLSTASRSTFNNVLHTLQVLDLHENPFHCDCRILWLKNLMTSERASVVNKPRDTRCAEPESFKRKSIADLSTQIMHCTAGADSPMVKLRFGLYRTFSILLIAYVHIILDGWTH